MNRRNEETPRIKRLRQKYDSYKSVQPDEIIKLEKVRKILKGMRD